MDQSTHYRLRLKIRGRVQGVGYRAFTRKHARALRLLGWVRNERDGTVTVIVEGPRPDLQELQRLCEEGPPFARVDQMESIWDEATGEFPGFDTRIGYD